MRRARHTLKSRQFAHLSFASFHDRVHGARDVEINICEVVSAISGAKNRVETDVGEVEASGMLWRVGQVLAINKAGGRMGRKNLIRAVGISRS